MEIVFGEVDQMFWFKCTIILAILCGVNSYHCVRDCDIYDRIPYEELICGVVPGFCSSCTPGTGHKLYDKIIELVPLERCYSICFSEVYK